MGVNFLSVWTVIFSLALAGFSTDGKAEIKQPLAEKSPLPNAPSQLDAQDSILGASQLDQLAKCLSSKGAKMYGAYWCPHCADQKETFGAAFRYINYVECDSKGENPNPQACREAGIQAYPTWAMPMNENLEGSQSPSALSKWSECPYLS